MRNLNRRRPGRDRKGIQARIARRIVAVYVGAAAVWVASTLWALRTVPPTLTAAIPIEIATAILVVAGSSILIYAYVRSLVGDVERHHKTALQAKLELVNRLALAAEYRDDARGVHNARIGRGAALIARRLGLPPDRCALISQAARLHDIGKIGVPDAILGKTGPLSDDERRIVERHVLYGAHLLEGSDSPLIQMAHLIALSHHERWDGSGYPYGLRGEETPVEGRIVAVVDVFDALTSARPYKEAWSVEEARAYIVREAGRLFDPAVVRAFQEELPEIVALWESGSAVLAGPDSIDLDALLAADRSKTRPHAGAG